MTNKGSCLCGGIEYEIEGELIGTLNCHCSMCRKAQGSAFRTRSSIKKSNFKFIQGEKLLKFYESSSGEYRSFCLVCGSTIITKFDQNPEVLGFALGTLDTDPGVKPETHIFVNSKATWHDITDNLPQHKEMPE